jgi:hypothetical protein
MLLLARSLLAQHASRSSGIPKEFGMMKNALLAATRYFVKAVGDLPGESVGSGCQR